VFLIAKQANVNAVDDKDQTPLHLAAAKGYSEMVRTLLEFNADIKLRDKNCCTALHLTVEGNFLETATLLVKRGVDLNAEEYRYGRTALHIAAEKGYTEMVTMLLIRGADMYASGDKFYSRTPLHLACIHGHTDVVRVLVKRGADVSVLSGFLDMNPLHLACEHGHWEASEILINKGMDLDVCGNHVSAAQQPLLVCNVAFFL
jgi:ankyrin repeat protein